MAARIAVTVGAATYVNRSAAEVSDVPPGVTTVTSTVESAVPAGLATTSCVPNGFTEMLVPRLVPK